MSVGAAKSGSLESLNSIIHYQEPAILFHPVDGDLSNVPPCEPEQADNSTDFLTGGLWFAAGEAGRRYGNVTRASRVVLCKLRGYFPASES